MKLETDFFDAADRAGEAYAKSRAATDVLRAPYDSHMRSAKQHEDAIKDAKFDQCRLSQSVQDWEQQHPLRAKLGWETTEVKHDRKEIGRLTREIPKHEQSFARHATEADKLYPAVDKAERETERLRKEHERLLAPEHNTDMPTVSSGYMGIPKGIGTAVDREETVRHEARQATLRETMGRVIRPPVDDREPKHGYGL